MTIGIIGPGRPIPRRGAVAAIAIGAVGFGIGLVLLWIASDVLVDWMWFSAIGHLPIFRTTIAAKTAVLLVVFAATAAILWINGWLALSTPGQPTPAPPPGWNAAGAPPPDPFEILRRTLPWRGVVAALAAGLALLVAWAETGNWDVVLQFFYHVPYGARDPLYGEDIGFYLFSLPAYVAVRNWMLLTLGFSALIAGTLHWLHGGIAFDVQGWSISPRAIAHGSALLGAFFAVKAWSYDLDRSLLLYGNNGVVVGAGYADVHVGLPLLWLMTGVSIAVACVTWSNIWLRTVRLPVIMMITFGSAVILSGIFTASFQRLVVKPSELELERPYIERTIALTRQAYNLHQIAAKPFPAEQDLSAGTLQANRATIDNIRLWDGQPLTDTYAQLQEIRTYYKFHDLYVDRYRLDGTYQSVVVAAREMQSSLLPPNAQTWVNLHLLFTHGNGAVMSPVTRKSAEGLPLLYLRDIPPVADGGPAIREPRIYYGQETDSYVVVHAGTPEFDYPKGKDNAYASYAGSGGVPLGGMLRTVVFAHYFGDMNLLLSRYITDDSRIMFRRNIRERIGTIAPFLTLDRDPYLVVSDGRLFWIQDAYTTSRYFPASQPAPDLDLNYIRNSVKVVVDAYHGTVDFYLVDPADPVAATYQRIFPSLFKPFAAMPADLRRHVRYPEDLFRIQAQLYQSFHMEAADVFYNREDLWQFARQPAGRGTVPMVPYYIIMRLPGETEAEFFIMIPMVPSRRDNMIAWLAARCDPPGYGKLIVYEFPKDKLVFGPFQIEARINQNTEISQQLSLWNQMGSRVIRGNLLVIPIENSILYVSPLYLRAEQGHLPELKRVIAAYGENVVMKETLAEALAALFPEPATAPAAATGDTTGSVPGAVAGQAREALEHYHLAMERLKSGDWAGFGTELDAMRRILENFGRQADR
ncbi:MAG: UPF0182 family protein [Rhizobiales bacterium]|nr:UPF0182 family protein [Hyphomicrobiales bacterium]